MADTAVVVGRWLVRLALICLLAAIAFAVTVLVVLPRAVHGTPLTVLTGSMSPDIPVGSVVIDRPVDPGTLHVGDIATYQKAPGVAVYITHRITKIDTSKKTTMFTFKGDANRGPDLAPVPATAIRGKVWIHVPYLGSIRDAIHTKGGIAGLATIVLGGYALVQLAGGLSEKRRGKMNPKPSPTDVLPLSRTGDALPASPLLVLATLPTAAADGMSPSDVSRMLHGTLIESNSETFTVIVAVDPVRDGDTLVMAHEIAPTEAVRAIAAKAISLETTSLSGTGIHLLEDSGVS